MKRWLFLIAAVLALTGCAADAEDPAYTQEPTEIISVTEAPGLTAPENMMEVSTGGSVQVYPLDRTDCTGFAPMGSNLLLFSGTDATTLTLLTGKEYTPSAEATLTCALSPDSPAVHVSEDGVIYYDDAAREIVTLDRKLSAVNRFPMPDTIIGAPALSPDGMSVYYCSADSLRCIDLDTRLDKLLSEISYPSQEVTGLHCDGTVLEVTVTDEDAQLNTLFLSAQTGETLDQISGKIDLCTAGQHYLAVRMDGVYQELLIGADREEVKLLSCGTDFGTAAPAENLGWTVVSHTYENENAATLTCYDPVTGSKTAALTLPGSESVREIYGNIDDTGIWFLRFDSNRGCDILCRWDPSMNPVEDAASYLAERHTEDNPDTEGLARCAGTAAALSEKYAVEVLIWKDIDACRTEEYPLTAEYQVPLIEDSLQQLEAALSRYPEGFLQQAASATDSGVLKICLVRSTGTDESGAQYWTEDSACIALCAAGKLGRNFHHQLFYLLENRVMGKSSLYDNWNTLNPSGFSYTLDYEAAEALEESQWLEGDNRAFIDRRSMSFPREDRAAIMEYAMTAGNEELFRSEILQQKLSKLCQGIRKAFGLKDSPEVFLWEQYLKEPLTP